MRIGLNLLHALPEIGGAWNYIASLLAGIAECDGANSYIAFVTPASKVLIPQGGDITTIELAVHSKSRPQRVLYENTVLQVYARKHHIDLMHWFANTQGLLNAVPAVVTFYDLMVFARPEAFSLPKRSYLQSMMRQTVRGAEMLLPMSEATAEDLVRVLSASRNRMSVIPPILEARFQVAPLDAVASLKARYFLPDRFWLYVAHFYPHKNHLRLLEAYKLLKVDGSKPWPLVLCGDLKGSNDLIQGSIRENGLEDDVLLISAGPPKETGHPRLTWSELPVLFSAAEAQVFPSLFEGAGIPVLEAMACGCPLLASDIPSVREFAAGAASYFDARDTSAMRDGMLRFQQDMEMRKLCQARGLARAAEFRAGPVVDRLVLAYDRTIKMSETRG